MTGKNYTIDAGWDEAIDILRDGQYIETVYKDETEESFRDRMNEYIQDAKDALEAYDLYKNGKI